MTTAVKPADVKAQKEFLLAVLSGARKGAAVNEEDLVLFAVAVVEKAEPSWLETQLKDARYTTERKTEVALELRGPLRKPILTALGVPPFVIG